MESQAATPEIYRSRSWLYKPYKTVAPRSTRSDCKPNSNELVSRLPKPDLLMKWKAIANVGLNSSKGVGSEVCTQVSPLRALARD